MDDIQSEVEGVFKQNSFEGQNSSVETPKAHRSLAQLWGDRLESARINLAPYRDKIAEMRQYARGEQHDDDSNALVRANLIHAHIRRSVNQTYARNPKFSIVPTENIDPAAYRKMRLFGKTCEIVLNRFLDDAGLKLLENHPNFKYEIIDFIISRKLWGNILVESPTAIPSAPVSYTHLTLPTNREV